VKGVKIQDDHENGVYRILHEEDNFGIIVKLGVTRIIKGETRKSKKKIVIYLVRIQFLTHNLIQNS